MAGYDKKTDNKSKRDFESNGQDKRYLPRWETDNRVIYRFDKDVAAHECRSKDISCAGACLIMQEKAQPQQAITLTIYLDAKNSVNVDGIVLWDKKIPEGYQVGINFSHRTPEKVKEEILNYAFEIKREDLVKHWFKGWNKTN